METEKYYAIYVLGEKNPMDAFSNRNISLEAVENIYTSLDINYRLKEVTAEEAKIIQDEPRKRKTSRITDVIRLVEILGDEY